MGSKTITVCSSFLIFVLLTSVFAFPASQNNGFLAYAATGDIDDDTIADIEFDDGDGEEVVIIKVSDGVFAIVYEGPSNDGFLKTVSISDDGETILVIGTLEFDDDDGDEPDIIHVIGDIFAIAYEKNDNDGFLKTVEIGSDGTIDPNDLGGGDDIIGTLKFQDGGDTDDPDMIKVSDGFVAIVYEGPSSDGFLKTVEIGSDGTIDPNNLGGGDDIIGTLEFDDVKGDEPKIIHVSGDVFAIVYEGPDNDGFLKTVEIGSDGTIDPNDAGGGDDIIDTLEFDDVNGDEPSITNVSRDIFAIAYEGPDDDGFLVTVDIDSDGNIADAVIDTLEFDDEDADHPIIIKVSNGVFAIAYDGPDSDGFLKTVEIGSSGDIADDTIDTLEFDDSRTRDPSISCVSNGVYAIAYEGPSSDGFIVTVGIEGSICVFKTGGGSDASEYLTKPTFGIDHKTGVVQVEGGFIANGKVFDVTDNWWTDFEKQAILVGQTNSFSAKAFAPHVINVVEFMFGIPEVGFAHMAEASIEVTIDREQNVTNVQVNQNGNLIDPGSVTATAVMAQCKSGDADKKCYFITVSGIFNEALMNDVFALKGIDFLRHFHLTYLNEGFTIFGNSLNPATTLLIASNVKGSSGLMEVTQIDKEYDMWVDESGIEYERNSFDSFIRTTPVEVVRDDPIVKVMTRMNSNFEAMKQNELDKATAIFDSSLIQKELPDSYSIPSGDRYDKLQDPEVQLKLFIERMRADDKMNQLMQMWYAKPNPNQLN